jgi:hypothetical protein
MARAKLEDRAMGPSALEQQLDAAAGGLDRGEPRALMTRVSLKTRRSPAAMRRWRSR